MQCIKVNHRHLPNNLPLGTDWIIMHNNSLQELCDRYPYSINLTGINLAFNNIARICPSFLESFVQSKHLKELGFHNNKLLSIPQEIQEIRSAKIWLGNNPFECNCDMLWMISWLANATLSSGEHLVPDYRNVTCSNGVYQGKPIYKLNRVHMGCYPDRMPSWEIALFVIVGITLVMFCVITFLAFRRWNEVKFWIYKHFDILDKRDKDENLDGIKFDGLLSYRYY